MAISIDGLISGTDTTAIVKQLIDLERRPILLKQQKQETLTAQKLAWQEISTKLLALETAANKMNTASEFASRSASFANNNTTGGNVLTVSSGSSSVVGSFNVKVTQLAQSEKTVLDQSFAATDAAVGASGTITLNDGTAHDIAVTANMTLDQIKSAINASSANVTASIINAGTTAAPSYRMILTGDDSGSANSFTAAATLDAGTLTFTENQAAADALMEVDGISITKSSNAVTDVIDGATLNLSTVGSGVVTMAADYDGIVSNINELVTAYNEATAVMASHTTYDQDKNAKGELFGNATLYSIYDRVRSILTSPLPGRDTTDTSTLHSLAQIGVKSDDSNALTVDDTKLRDALKNNFDQVQNLFIPNGTGTYETVAASYSTSGGTYDTQIIDNGGGDYRLQMRKTGTSTWYTLDQNGGFASGVAGTPLEGALFRTGTLSAGDVGTTGSVGVYVGVAQQMADAIGQFTEFSSEGLIFNQNRSIERQDKDLQTQITDLETRLAKKEEDLKIRFANLEVLLGKLTSQQEYLNGQLGSLGKNWK
jgi:flagellar hook-associated protein 2